MRGLTAGLMLSALALAASSSLDMGPPTPRLRTPPNPAPPSPGPEPVAREPSALDVERLRLAADKRARKAARAKGGAP